MNAYDTIEEQELAERLSRLGRSTRYDPEALQKIVERGVGPRLGQRGRVGLLAVAAAALAVAALAGTFDRGGERVGTTAEQRPPGRAGSDALMTLPLEPYSVELLWSKDTLYFRRTDDVGNRVDGPDGRGAVLASSWPGAKGPRCLTSDGGFFLFPDQELDPRAFTYGLIGADITAVDVVHWDGSRAHAKIGPVVAGELRVWMVERISLPNIEDTVDRIEGLDKQGKVVAQIVDVGALTDLGTAPTCASER